MKEHRGFLRFRSSRGLLGRGIQAIARARQEALGAQLTEVKPGNAKRCEIARAGHALLADQGYGLVLEEGS